MGVAAAWMAYDAGRFLLASPEMALIHTGQITLSGNHYVSRASVLEVFAGDQSRSVLRIPLAERRRQIESIPWVEQAAVRRVLPNAIQVQIEERTPIAFLREGSNLSLVDVHGAILDRPAEGNFHFPVVTGITADMPPEDREKRMQLFAGFSQQIGSVRTGAMDQVSEADLSDARDLQATMTGLQDSGASGTSSEPEALAGAPVLVHFGDGDFAGKYETLIEDIGQWRAVAGRVRSVDLRFSREAVVNPDTAALAQRAPKQAGRARRAARHWATR